MDDEFDACYKDFWKKSPMCDIPVTDDLVKEHEKQLMKVISKNSICSQVVGFTLTFKPSYHHLDPDDLYTHGVTFFTQDMFKAVDFIALPEFMKSGILHFHGLVWNLYNKQVAKLFRLWWSDYGFVKIEWHIRSYDNWTNYIRKSLHDVGYIPFYSSSSHY